MAFLNTADISVCKLLEDNYTTIRDEYLTFKTEYLYNDNREIFDEDDQSSWELWKEGHKSSLNSAKSNEIYKDLDWNSYVISPIRRFSNWYGLSIDSQGIWEGILLASRASTPFTLSSTLLCDKWFSKTINVLRSHKTDIITSATIAVFPANKIIPRHNGYETITRIHFPLYVPVGDIRFCVGEEIKSWKTGKCLAFNDIIEHNAWNNTDKDRIALIVDILRR
jgi:Aspartyl/Asparaginyl beta-hydroxylase